MPVSYTYEPRRFPARIETDRLRMEGPVDDATTFDDFHDFHTGDGAEEMARYSKWEARDDEEYVRSELWDYMVEGWAAETAAYYVLRERSAPDETAGIASLEFDWDRMVAEPGVYLHPDHWGNGYSGERAAALVDLALAELDCEVVEIPPLVANENSYRAVSKYVEVLGGEYVGVLRNHLDLPGHGPADCHFFQITREGYETARERRDEPVDWSDR